MRFRTCLGDEAHYTYSPWKYPPAAIRTRLIPKNPKISRLTVSASFSFIGQGDLLEEVLARRRPLLWCGTSEPSAPGEEAGSADALLSCELGGGQSVASEGVK